MNNKGVVLCAMCWLSALPLLPWPPDSYRFCCWMVCWRPNEASAPTARTGTACASAFARHPLRPDSRRRWLSVFDERPSTAVCFYHAASARLYERLEDRTIDIIVQPDDGNDVPPDCRAVTLVQPEAVLRFGGRPVTARACPGENPRQSVVWKREAPPALVVLLADRLQGEGALQSVSNPLNFTGGACAGSA